MDSFQQPGVKAVNADRCNHSAEKAQGHAFQQKRPADKPVGCTYIFHNDNFLTAGKNRQTDSIGNNKQRCHS